MASDKLEVYGEICIGDYVISAKDPNKPRPGKVWIWMADGPNEGEGGEFDVDKLHKLIADYYAGEF